MLKTEIPAHFFATDVLGRRFEYKLLEIIPNNHLEHNGCRDIILKELSTNDEYTTDVELLWFEQRVIEVITQ